MCRGFSLRSPSFEIFGAVLNQKVQHPSSISSIELKVDLNADLKLPTEIASPRSCEANSLNCSNLWNSNLQADEELVDPKKYLEERSKPKCVKALHAYQECAKRVQADDTGHKHCTGQYFDYWSCIDQCVASKLFDNLK